jgi:hypothetical protein
VVDGNDDASGLLGLEGLAVQRVVLTAFGVKVVQLVTDDPDAARCPVCRSVSTSGKDWVLTLWRAKTSTGVVSCGSIDLT